MDLKAQLALQEKNKKLTAELNTLKKLVGKEINTKEELLSAMDKYLTPIPAIRPRTIKIDKGPDQRELVVMLNDSHYGLVVDPAEVNNLNEFGWEQASRRTAALIDQTIKFKPHNRSKTKRVHLVINGDIICGNIHGDKTSTIDKMVYQINGALHILTHAVGALAKEFQEVVVHCAAGNHDELVSKREGNNRVLSEVYDSNIHYVFYALSTIFEKNTTVKFNVPKSPVLFLNLLGGRVLVTHGHLLFSKELGNPGRSINVKGLSDALHRFNLGEIKQGNEPVKLALFGHVHTHANFTSNDGVEVFVAPSLSGLDSYAFSLGINANFTGQVLFESTKKHIKGDSRLIHVHEYDKRTELDKIIPPYKRTLTFR